MSGNEDIKAYQDKKAKAEDFKSSGYSLIIVGVLGIVFLVLMELGFLPFHLAGSGKYITLSVMGVLFVIFIIVGISSFKSSKMYAEEAKAEDDLTDKIKIWVRENLSADEIKSIAGNIDELPDEMKYFRYFAILKDNVKHEFGNVNASYLESICEELYSELFE